MKEVIIRLNSDHIKIKGGEYVRDLVRCAECKNKDDVVDYCHKADRWINANDFCSYGEVRDE